MEILLLIFSGLAAIGAFISVFTTMRQGYASIIASRRFDWMSDVRQKVTQFLDVFFDSEISIDVKENKLVAKKYEILVYIDARSDAGYDNRDQQSIVNSLDKCIASLEKDVNQQKNCVNELVRSVQICLANTHSRAKQEAEAYKRHF